jgi:hypothetical protein
MPVVPELILLTLAFAGATAVAEVLVRRRWVTEPALLQGFFGDIGRGRGPGVIELPLRPYRSARARAPRMAAPSIPASSPS